MTALTIVISGVYLTKRAQWRGADLQSLHRDACSRRLAVVVMLFAYSTMISYATTGQAASTFRRERVVDIVYKCSTADHCRGRHARLHPLIDFSDAIYFLMAVPNVIGLYCGAGRQREMKVISSASQRSIRSTRETPTQPVGSADTGVARESFHRPGSAAMAAVAPQVMIASCWAAFSGLNQRVRWTNTPGVEGFTDYLPSLRQTSSLLFMLVCR